MKHKSTLEKYRNILKNELNYSDVTVSTYILHLKEYLGYFNKSPLHLTYGDYKWFIQNHKFGYSKHNQFISSVKLFYKHILNYNLKIELFKRPRKEKRLPDILSQSEIDQLIDSYKNIKHKSIIATLYYFGLRRSELVKLRLFDFDKNRNLLHIKQAKGNKDRFVYIQDKWRIIANEYAIKYRIKDLLFEGESGNYTFSSMNNVLKQGLKRSNITKRITLHSLRRSFACHLYEKGVSLLAIQNILGHAHYKTTLIYVQVSEKCYEETANIF